MIMKAKLIEFLGRVPLVGSALRRLARNYPEGSVVEIRTGLAAGFRWKRYHRYVSGYWLGHYELEIQHALKRLISMGDTVYDIGANAGFFTLVAAKLVGSEGRVIAFDPAPDNLQSIRAQLELNNLGRCIAVDHAIGGTAGTAIFSFAAPGSPMGHLGESTAGERSLEVRVTTIDAAADSYGPPRFIKLDIEGAEIDAMAGAARVLREVRPSWLIELHGPPCEQSVKRTLRDAGYQFFDLSLTPADPEAELPRHFVAKPA